MELKIHSVSELPALLPDSCIGRSFYIPLDEKVFLEVIFEEWIEKSR